MQTTSQIRPKASTSSRDSPVKHPFQRRPRASLSPVSPIKMPRTMNLLKNTPGPSPGNGVGANSPRKRTPAKKRLAVRRSHPSPSPACPVPVKMPRAMKPPKTTPVASRTNGAKAKSPKSGTPTTPKLPLPRKRKAAMTSVAVQTSPSLKGLRKRHKPDPAQRRKPSAT
ncbi:hypothetical protein NP493_246g00043 [Ridgeia piscesae]|uniref:Uncharacterized protein n=1 Tax=Ridgeia piscesae TaxID=27915 RepID=A0AAD9NZ19_RIDPI|nr:hypothetical protein NP493_246g00043 [Ridgeia piscesae]